MNIHNFSALLLALAVPAAGAAQDPCVATTRSVGVQSPRLRLNVITDTAPFSDVIADAVGCGRSSARREVRALRLLRQDIRAAIHLPELRAAALGGLADARGSGAMWSGRGTSLWASGGLSLDSKWMHAVFTPAIWWAENRYYDTYPARSPELNTFASPWYHSRFSIDLPSRFGSEPFLAYELGESAVWGTWRNVDGGIATSTQAFGPGVNNHLLLGGDTPGIPRLFLRPAAPVRTPLGLVSGTAFLGMLVESRFFDRDSGNDTRRMFAWTAALTPGDSSAIAFGVSQGFLKRDELGGPVNHIIALSARARTSSDGRAWIEFGRSEWPESIRRFLTAPSEGLAYIVGFEQLSRTSRGDLIVTAEAMNVEQQSSIEGEVLGDFYTSNAKGIPQGWSHRGRVLGVPTGPGSQSQWLAIDWIARRWSAGIFGERVRWNEDALLREPLAFPNRHDVSLRMGLRAGYVFANYEATLQLSTGKRLNYLFQNGSYIPGFRTVDVSIPQLRMSLVPLNR